MALAASLIIPGSLRGEDVAAVEEYKLKAAFLLNFARFTIWPDKAFAAADSPLVIGIIGKDPFGQTLDETLKDKKAGGRPVVVKRFDAIPDISSCHLLFVSASLEPQYSRLVEKLKDTHVVTVGETKDFAAKFGVLGFTVQDKKIRFEANLDASKRAGAELSSKLLSVAIRVRDARSEQ